jgi:hypothetical protein
MPLKFDHNADYSSSVSDRGISSTLRCQPLQAFWPHVLFPNNYHGSLTPYEGYGGLTGELTIFLALMALSMPYECVPA